MFRTGQILGAPSNKTFPLVDHGEFSSGFLSDFHQTSSRSPGQLEGNGIDGHPIRIQIVNLLENVIGIGRLPVGWMAAYRCIGLESRARMLIKLRGPALWQLAMRVWWASRVLPPSMTL